MYIVQSVMVLHSGTFRSGILDLFHKVFLGLPMGMLQFTGVQEVTIGIPLRIF